MKKTLVVVLAALMAVSMLLACGFAIVSDDAAGEAPADGYTIGISLRWATNAFVHAVQIGAEECGAEWSEKLGVPIDFIVTNGDDNDAQRQVIDMEDLAAQNIDALLVFPGDSLAIVPMLEQFYDGGNGIPVGICDIGVETEEYTSWVCPDYYKCGYLAGEAMVEVQEPGAKIAVFNHAPTTMNCILRCQGFYDACKDGGLDPLDIAVINGVAAEDGKLALEDAITANPDLKGVFVGNYQYNTGFISAAEETGTDITIVCFDLDAVTLDLVKDGEVAASAVNDPYGIGWETMNQVMYALNGEDDKIEKHVEFEAKILNQDNWEEFEGDPQVYLTK